MSRLTNRFKYQTNISSVLGIDDIMAELAKHENEFRGTDAQNLIYFSRTYAVTNRNIYKACLEGYFANPEQVISLQLKFAHLYFNTLNIYAKTGYLPPIWRYSANNYIFSIMPAGLSLFFAITAHIKYDAPASLASLYVPPELLGRDYNDVNRLLYLSSREIVQKYNPNKKYRHIRELARKLLIFAISYYIFHKRKQAWRSFTATYTAHSYHTNELKTISVLALNNKALPMPVYSLIIER